MHRSRRIRALGLAGAGLFAPFLAPGVTLADCMMPPPIEETVATAEIVFVGTVEATANRGRTASIAVEEIWRGPDQPSSLVLRGGPDGNTATSVDRTFEVGVRYLFVPFVEPGAGMTESSCTPTRPWGGDLEALRPEIPRAPIAVSTEQALDVESIVASLGIAVFVAVVLLGVGLLARGRGEA